jgi:FG-GAP-like repeat
MLDRKSNLSIPPISSFTMKMLKASSLMLSLLITVPIVAQTTNTVHFERVQLSNEFYAEGGAWGDFNGDGKGDVVVGPWIYWGNDFENKSRIYEGDAIDPIGYSENFLMDSGDINGDGKIDIIVLGFPGKESWWFENPGAEKATALWPRHVMLDSVDNESPLMADINGDGKLDLVGSSRGHYGYASHAGGDPKQMWKFHHISPNNNYGKFTHGLGVGDVNNDGHLDLMEKDGWWQNPGKTTDELWQFHPFAFSAGGGSQMFAVDFDGDGRNEVLTSLAAHGFGLAYYKATNKEATQFEKIEIMSDNPASSPVGLAVSQLHAVIMADVNGDKIPDIVTGKRWWAHANGDPGAEQPSTLMWFETQRQDGRVRFAAHVIDNSSGVGTDITAGDVNGDGLVDIVSGTKRGTHVFLQRPKGMGWGEYLVPGAAAKDAFGQRPAMELIATKGGWIPGLKGRGLNFDFKAATLIDWEARGPAGRQALQEGQINTGSANHNLVGELISRPFKLSKPRIQVQLAGSDDALAFVEVIAESTGKTLASARGDGSEQLSTKTLDVANGKDVLVRVRIVDHTNKGFIKCSSVLMVE